MLAVVSKFDQSIGREQVSCSVRENPNQPPNCRFEESPKENTGRNQDSRHNHPTRSPARKPVHCDNTDAATPPCSPAPESAAQRGECDWLLCSLLRAVEFQN